MNLSQLMNRRRSGVAALASLAAGGLTLGLAAGHAGAGTIGACAGEHVYAELNIELVQIDDRLLGVHDVALDEALPAGTYEVETIAFDGWLGRAEDRPAELESYVIQFVDASGDVVGETPATPDLADDVDEVEHKSSWQVTLHDDAVGMRFAQIVDFQPPNDLVWVGCVGITDGDEPTTTTTEPTTTTTEPTTTTTTTAPTTTTTEEDLTPSTTAPATTAPPTTAAPTTAAPTSAVPFAQPPTTEPQTAVLSSTAARLPETGAGAGTGALVVVGTLALGAGTALVVRTRRLL